MTFDDEDLTILTNWAKTLRGDLVFDALPSGKLIALLARLAAAEKACLFFQNSLRFENVDDGVLSEWRKAAGK